MYQSLDIRIDFSEFKEFYDVATKKSNHSFLYVDLYDHEFRIMPVITMITPVLNQVAVVPQVLQIVMRIMNPHNNHNINTLHFFIFYLFLTILCLDVLLRNK